jgi:hypothetical protein
LATQLGQPVGEGFLHRVGRVHAGRQASIQMSGDHTVQPAAVTRQQLLRRWSSP